MESKKCKVCSEIKAISSYGNLKNNPKFYYATCKKCLSEKRERDRKPARHWKWPYPKGINTMLKNSKYIKDKNKLFDKHGNGWWWGDGYWNGKTHTLADQNKKYIDNKKEV